MQNFVHWELASAVGGRESAKRRLIERSKRFAFLGVPRNGRDLETNVFVRVQP